MNHFGIRSCALLLAAAALCAVPRSAFAFTGGTQLFAWAERESAPIGQTYLPNSNYTPFGASAQVGVTRDGVGQYSVLFANHDPFNPTQAQVMAYGTDSTRCKFFKRAEPFFSSMCRTSSGASAGFCTRVFVQCFSASGGPVDSKFAISFTGISFGNNPPLRGPAAFFETTGGGTGVAQSYSKFNGVVGPSLTPQYLNSATTAFPRITRNFAGNYRILLPRVGTSDPGFAQITALGSGSAHCLTTLPQQSGSDIVFNVNCWAGSSRVDSDFVVNYDQVLTRQGTDYQGARGLADSPGSSFYTPTRSYNSGAITFGTPGTNTVIRLGTGAYAIDHTSLTAIHSSPWVGPFTNDGSYCKLRSWTSDFGGPGVTLDVRCFNASGSPSDTMFFETYQASQMGPQ